MTYVIGLTGSIASGKSNLSDALRREGAPVIDADQISRALTAPGGPALPGIEKTFGARFVQNGMLDRKALGALVFSDKKALSALNRLTHPLILQRIIQEKEALERLNAPACVLDAPLLFEAGLEDLCDTVWCAWLPMKLQIKRLRERDGLTEKEARQRIGSQLPPLVKRRRSDFVIDTRGTREESAQKAVLRYREVLAALASKNEEEPR